MAFIPVENTAQVELVYLQGGQVVENTLYFTHNTLNWDADLLTDLAAFILTWWNDYIKPLQPNEVILQAIRATSLDSQNAPGITYTTGLPAAGTNTGDPSPNNVTVAVSFRTLLRGRSFRGRNYWIGLMTNQMVGSVLQTADLNAIRLVYVALLADLVVEPYTWVVVSRYSNNAPRAAGVVTPVTSISIDPVVDSMRRRLPGRGS